MSIVKRPTIEQLQKIVSSLHMSMSEREIGEYLDVLEGTMQAYDRVEQLPDYLPEVRYPRTPGTRPSASENPLNAWYVKSEVQGRALRPAGRQARRAQGQRLPGRRADDERRVHARRLRARCRRHHRHAHPRCRRHHRRQGALRVLLPLGRQPHVGRRARCTTRTRSATRPAARRRLRARWSAPARSRWRSAATRAARSACRARTAGCYGMKPTHGLVPYTGVMPIEATIDHTGPMTTTVADNALLLEVIAGPDGLDPRQYNVRVDKYTAALGRGVAGLRIGVVTEGFRHAVSGARRRPEGARRRPIGFARSARSSRRCRSRCTSTARRSGRRSRSRACRRR